METSLNVTLLNKLVTKTILPNPACEQARKVYHDIKALAVLGVYVRPKVTYFPPTEGLESGYEVIDTQVGRIRVACDMRASEWISQYHNALGATFANMRVLNMEFRRKNYKILKSNVKCLEENGTVNIEIPDFNNIGVDYCISFSELCIINITSQMRSQGHSLKESKTKHQFVVIGADGIITVFEIGEAKHKTLLKLKPN